MAHVLIVVARETGQPFAAVARQPYALSLWVWAHLTVADRIDAYVRRSQAIAAAHLTAMAYHAPKLIREQSDKLSEETGLAPTAGELLEDAQETIDLMKQFDALEERT